MNLFMGWVDRWLDDTITRGEMLIVWAIIMAMGMVVQYIMVIRLLHKARKTNLRAMELVEVMRIDHRNTIMSADQYQQLIKLQRSMIETLQEEKAYLGQQLAQTASDTMTFRRSDQIGGGNSVPFGRETPVPPKK